MIDHVSIIVGDLNRAERFYDAIMDALGYPKVVRDEDRIGYGERSSPNIPSVVTFQFARVYQSGANRGATMLFVRQAAMQ